MKQGDLIWISFSPQTGHEQMGRRPALIVSNDTFNQKTGLCLVCPVTNTDNGFPLHVPLQETLTTGVVMVEHIRSIDPMSRNAEHIESVPAATLAKVLLLMKKIF